ALEKGTKTFIGRLSLYMFHDSSAGPSPPPASLLLPGLRITADSEADPSLLSRIDELTPESPALNLPPSCSQSQNDAESARRNHRRFGGVDFHECNARGFVL